MSDLELIDRFSAAEVVTAKAVGGDELVRRSFARNMKARDSEMPDRLRRRPLHNKEIQHAYVVECGKASPLKG
jgi:hypothetical protein